MKFDPSGLERAFDTMRDRATEQGKTLARKQGNFFVRMARRIGWDSAPSVSELVAVREKLGWHMKRRGNAKTPDEELARRIKRRGTFARGWRFLRYEASMSGYKIKIWIRNRVGYSQEIDDRDHTADKAAAFVGKAFQRDLNRMAQKITGGFGK